MSNKPKRQNQPWTEEEMEQLKSLWGEKSIPIIASRLRRSIDSVKVKVQRLHLGPWIENGEYIAVMELYRLLKPDNTHGGSRDFTRQLELHGAPIIKAKINNCSIKMIKINKF